MLKSFWQKSQYHASNSMTLVIARLFNPHNLLIVYFLCARGTIFYKILNKATEKLIFIKILNL